MIRADNQTLRCVLVLREYDSNLQATFPSSDAMKRLEGAIQMTEVRFAVVGLFMLPYDDAVFDVSFVLRAC